VRVGFGVGAIWSGLLLEKRRGVQQHAALGLGGDRTARAFIRPVESADATSSCTNLAKRIRHRPETCGPTRDAGAKLVQGRVGTRTTGLRLAERYGFSTYDAMIAASALHAGCDTCGRRTCSMKWRSMKACVSSIPFAFRADHGQENKRGMAARAIKES
jgi:hypothetical protein